MLTLGSLAPVVHLLLPGLLQQLRVQHVPTLHAGVQSTTCIVIVFVQSTTCKNFAIVFGQQMLNMINVKILVGF